MYKRFWIEELKSIQNNFFWHLSIVMKREKTINLSEFLKRSLKDNEDIYYFERWEAIFRLSQSNEFIILIDEKDRIEVKIKSEQLWEINSMFKSTLTKKSKVLWQKSIESILLEEFRKWIYSKIDWKPYIVYDIETTSDSNNIKDLKFLIWYSMKPEENNTMSYEYIDRNWLENFVKKLINFDWWIIWFNNIWFDNPVCTSNLWLDDSFLDIINKKSIDIYTFIRKLTWKRLSLNKVSEALVWSWKTLTSWLEAEELRKQYEITWDKKFLEEYKKFCKNDVRITSLVLLYLLHYKKVFIEDEEIHFETKDLVEKWNYIIKSDNQNNQNQSIF